VSSDPPSRRQAERDKLRNAAAARGEDVYGHADRPVQQARDVTHMSIPPLTAQIAPVMNED
jgi:hypothetical protein